MGELTLTQKEKVRLQVLNGVLGDQVSKDQAAEILGVSERHVWRILAAYRKEGAVALAHRNRGRRPSNATSEATMAEVVALARSRYPGANHTHMTELLAEREGISLSRSVVRRILVGAGLASPRRRRPPRHRVRRQRMPQEGMLVQIDASHHPWLEERGPRFALLLAVDDATSTVPYALFHQVEDTFGYFLLMEGMARRAGVPLALYSDRHAVFQHQREPRQAPAGPTQFGRAMQELGVQQIFARSPQAKGRVERTAGTFQDRLVTELRLAGATTIEKANQVLWSFLPRFNERFGVPPDQPESAYQPVDSDLDVAGILCFKHRRKVAKDNTVKYNWHTLQLLPSIERPSYAGVQVEVQEQLDGQLVVRYKDRTIPTQEAPPRPGVLRALNGARGHNFNLDRFVNGGVHKHLREQLAALESVSVEGEQVVADGASRNGTNRIRTRSASPRRKPTARQRARWEAVQEAKRQGLSIRAIARELGIHRETVRKYVDTNNPPVYRRGVKANTS